MGPGAVDKMIDIGVKGINMGAALEDFENGDFAYAPPFSTSYPSFVQAVYVLVNKLEGRLISYDAGTVCVRAAKDYKVIDVAPSPSIRGAVYVKSGSGDRAR